MVLTFMYSLLPLPAHAPAISDDEDEVPQPAPSQSVITRTPIPPYGQRVGWKPLKSEDFGTYTSSSHVYESPEALCRGWWFISRMSCCTISIRLRAEEGECFFMLPHWFTN